MNHRSRCLLGGLLAGLIMIVFSPVIHVLLFGSYWDEVDFSRSTGTWQMIPGAAILTIGFGILLAWAYSKLHTVIPGNDRKTKGFKYGLIVYLTFIPFAETWNYLQLELPFEVVIAGLVHYLITLPLGGAAIAAIYGDTLDPAPTDGGPRHQHDPVRATISSNDGRSTNPNALQPRTTR